MVSDQRSTEAVAAVQATLLDLLRRNDYVIQKNCEGISNDASLIRLQEDGSNLNWLLGHISASRDACTRLLGAEPHWPKEHARRYGRGSAVPEQGSVETIDSLLAAVKATGERFATALAQASEDALSLPNPRNAEERVIDALFFLVWHDTYHAGQTALYRRLAGLSGVF